MNISRILKAIAVSPPRHGVGRESSHGRAAELPGEISLNGDWDFYYMREIAYAKDNNKVPQLPEAKEFTTTMPVPGYWTIT